MPGPASPAALRSIAARNFASDGGAAAAPAPVKKSEAKSAAAPAGKSAAPAPASAAASPLEVMELIEKRIKPPVPSNCLISGLDFATRAIGFPVGQPCSVNIMTHKTNGGDTFNVDVLNPKGKVLDRGSVEVQDRSNGTYVVNFTPQEVGEHQLIVKAGSKREHIRGSPTTLVVKQPVQRRTSTLGEVYQGDDFRGDVLPGDFKPLEWTFFPFSWQGDSLLDGVFAILDSGGYLEEFSVPKDKLRAFLIEARSQYHTEPPYHTFWHAVDVMQACATFMHMPSIKAAMPSIDRFAALIAAVLHDIDHPGYTSAFLALEGHPLVAKHGERGTLEKHHVETALKMLATDRFNILENCTDEQATTIKATIELTILATDMSCHFAIVKPLDAMLSGCETPFKLTRENYDSEHRTAVIQIMIKCADVSNGMRPRDSNERWVSRIVSEFHRQGDLEAERGYKVSPGMGRNEAVPGGQLFFFNFFCRDLYRMLTQLVPETQKLYDECFLTNYERWEKMNLIEKESAEKIQRQVRAKSGQAEGPT